MVRVRKIEVYRIGRYNLLYRWWLKASNGRIVCCSETGITSKAAAMRHARREAKNSIIPTTVEYCGTKVRPNEMILSD